VVLSDENVVQPDIVFIARSRLRIIGKACIRGAPDLIVEILSPKTAARDRVVKRKLYASCGVREYWIVDPDEETIEILVLSPHGFKCVRVWRPPARLVSPTYPRLRIPLGPIFA
jgi:Uma2 family endonuclease